MPLPPDFDPDAPLTDDTRLYGMPLSPEECGVQVIPVPWEATTSYGRGTRGAPDAIRRASLQLDLHDLEYGDLCWQRGVGMLAPMAGIEALADAAEPLAQAVIASGGTLPALAAQVDEMADQIHADLHARAGALLAAGRIPAVLGGDHSTPYGLIRASSEAYPGLGILHIDAHLDLRVAYLGFRHSHASIFHNVLQLPGVGRVVGVGFRDVGRAEVARSRSEPRHMAFFDHELEAGGGGWQRRCEAIVGLLPPNVHVSLDIDGLDPSLCPGTGTPVPGGLSWRQLQQLLQTLSEQRRVVSFDLCEVGPQADSEWDANVGARVLYKLAGCALRGQDRIR